MEEILIDHVKSNLRLFMYGSAIFLCERLCAEFPSEKNLQLLAGCFLRNNQAYSAYHILKGTQTPQSRYLFALSCFQMDLLKEAESALRPSNDPGIITEVPNGAAGHYLLGLIYRCSDRTKNAIHHFKESLSIDPLMWSAYEELCKLGCLDEKSLGCDEAFLLSLQKHHLNQCSASHRSHLSNSRALHHDDVSPRLSKLTQDCKNRNGVQGTSVQFHSSSTASSYYNTPPQIAPQLSAAVPPPICRNVPPNYNNENAVKSVVNSAVQPPRRKFLDEGKLRKISGRLFNDSAPRRSSRLASDGVSHATSSSALGNGNSHPTNYPGSSKSVSVAFRPSRKPGQASVNDCPEDRHADVCDDYHATSTSASSSHSVSMMLPPDDTVAKVLIGISDVLQIFKLFREGYRLSSLYRCQEALDVYTKLPQRHYNTAWVLSQVGRAYFELVNYLEADRVFNHARITFPYSLEGMDVYSTVLYHRKDLMKLSYLTKDLTSVDRLAPQSWCAMGNCYGLQKDHETALKSFERAVQLNGKFAYAHTLCGHEYAAMEDFDGSIKCYQRALLVDARHYNAWYGLGIVYLRQEKFEFAEHHFRRAHDINPHSSVIMCYLGMALHSMRRNSEAMMMIERSIRADKKNPLPVYQMANVLASAGHHDRALVILEKLVENAPKESSIYALMGKIYKSKNMVDKAMLHFGLALDLKPPVADVAVIRSAMDKLHVPDGLHD